MSFDIIHPMGTSANLKDYDDEYSRFSWDQVEAEFDWYKTGKVNIAHEAIDRHCNTERRNKVALYFVDNEGEVEYTFDQMRMMSNRFGNVLRTLGVGKGDRVFIFMPRSPGLYISLIGIAKVGAVVGPLFEAFMEEGVKDRLADSGAIAVVTTPELKDRIPKADLPSLKYIIVVGSNGEIGDGEIDYDREMSVASDDLDIEWMQREDPLILHYTSGSTGKPKGVLHVHNAMIGHLQTTKWVLDLRDDDVYWCTADPGWVTGTSYGIYGPWLAGATNLIRGGRFDPDAWYTTIQKYRVSVWYSAPTAFRRLMTLDDSVAKKYDLSSLRLIFSAGEPLNPVVIEWSQKILGMPIHDTWWMTETGMQIVANYPSLPIRPGSMGKPFPGVTVAILDDDGMELGPKQIGNLAIKRGWPAMMRRIWKNDAKFKEYFPFGPWFISGDSAYRDEDGYYWFQGRVDDVIKTSGERVGPFEVESILLEHPAIVEAGVIGKPDPLRGHIIKAFVCPRQGIDESEELKEDLTKYVKTRLAAHAVPREIEFRCGLPKTRSGKIMRRVLKAWDLGLPTGDLSTMDDSLDFGAQDVH
ncbi:MAG: acetate--CoA ligase [Chloroflexota bacterium]|nr:acetate--CoA ligase [Chloroflexota bacterium]